MSNTFFNWNFAKLSLSNLNVTLLKETYNAVGIPAICSSLLDACFPCILSAAIRVLAKLLALC